MPEPQPSQENGRPSAPPSPAVAWGQRSAPSSSQQVLIGLGKPKRAVASGPPGSSLETPGDWPGRCGWRGGLSSWGRAKQRLMRSRCWVGGHAERQHSLPRALGGHQGGRGPSCPPTAVGSAPLPATPTPGATERRDPSQGELCPQSRDGVLLTRQAGSQPEDLSTRVWPKWFWRRWFEPAPVWRYRCLPPNPVGGQLLVAVQPRGDRSQLLWPPGRFTSNRSHAPRSSVLFPGRQGQSQARWIRAVAGQAQWSP